MREEEKKVFHERNEKTQPARRNENNHFLSQCERRKKNLHENYVSSFLMNGKKKMEK